MMRRIILLLMLSNSIALAQYNNNHWVIGLKPTEVNFTDTGVENHLYGNATYPYNAFARGHSIISNDSIILSCNGYFLFNGRGVLIEDGDNIVPKKLVDQQDLFSGLQQQSIILPKKDSQYYVFVWSLSDASFDIGINTGIYSWDILTYSIVDMKANNGEGKVISKMNYLLQDDTLGSSQMSAVRHANGRDWWLVKPKGYGHQLYTYLVSADGISPPNLQIFDSPSLSNGNRGQSNFSEDGSLYALCSIWSDVIQINKFDRCTGLFTKYRTVTSPIDTVYYYDPILEKDTSYTRKIGTGICFSPNNKYVYIAGQFEIYQYDIELDEFTKLRTDTIINWNEYMGLYNAANGRIYAGYHDGLAHAMSYIEFPNNKGKAAGLCQLCYQTVDYTAGCPPNMPNYNLGALVGSDCDTIRPTVDTSTNIESVLVPNAFSPNGDGLNDTWHILNIPYLQQEGIEFQQVGVYNRWGNCVFKSNDINFAWRAKGWAMDSYYYYIRYKRKDGVEKVQKGSVELVR